MLNKAQFSSWKSIPSSHLLLIQLEPHIGSTVLLILCYESGGKIPLNQKAVKLSSSNQEHHIHAGLIQPVLSAFHSATVHYWLLRIRESKGCGWSERCLSALADRQMLLMGTVWAWDWRLKGQTPNVVISTASGPPQTPLPVWAQVNSRPIDPLSFLLPVSMC